MFAIVKADTNRRKAVSVIPVLYDDAWTAQRDADAMNKTITTTPKELRFVVVQYSPAQPKSAGAKGKQTKTPKPTAGSLFEILAAPVSVDENLPQNINSSVDPDAPAAFLDMG